MPKVRFYVNDIDEYFPLYVSANKAADILGVSSVTARRMLERGDIEGTKSAGQWKVSTKDLFKYLGLAGEVAVDD
jgi:excisionase family DNA binding protein